MLDAECRMLNAECRLLNAELPTGDAARLMNENAAA